MRAISEGINNSYAVLVLCSAAALRSRWVREEFLWAKQKDKRILPVLLEDVTGDDAFFGLHSSQAVHWPQGAGVPQTVLSALQAPVRILPESTASYARIMAAPRTLELEYLDRLRLEEFRQVAKYTPLAGNTQRGYAQSAEGSVKPVVMSQRYAKDPLPCSVITPSTNPAMTVSDAPATVRNGSGSRTQPRSSTTSDSSPGVRGDHCSDSRPSRIRTTRSATRAARGS